MSITESLKKFHKKATGIDAEGKTIETVIEELAENYTPGEGGGGGTVNPDDLHPYNFIMGNAPKYFNGQVFARLLLEKCPEVANYELETYGGSDSYLSISANNSEFSALNFDVSDFNFILYRYGGTEISVQLNEQTLPKTVYQLFYDMGEIEFPNETFQDKYRRTYEIDKLEIWIEASKQYILYFTASEVKTFLYSD